MKHSSQISFLGVRVDNVTFADVETRFRSLLSTVGQYFVVTVNPEFVMAAQKNKAFMSALNSAQLAVPDGFGLVLMSRLARTPLTERVSGSDLTILLARLAAEQGSSIALYGGATGVATRAGQELKRRFPQLNIVFAGNEFDESGVQRTEPELLDLLRSVRPAILLVALGAPKQELFLSRVLAQLPDVRIGIGVGGTFDYLAGVVPRAPQIFRSLGLEWFWRLLLQPSRLSRIVTATLRFPFAVLTHRHAIEPYRPS